MSRCSLRHCRAGSHPGLRAGPRGLRRPVQAESETLSSACAYLGSGTALPAPADPHRRVPRRTAVEFVYLPGLHSGGGIHGVAKATSSSVRCRAGSSRGAGARPRYMHLSDDGLVVALIQSSTIDGLTTEQVREIYAGEHETGPSSGVPTSHRHARPQRG